MGQFDRKAQSQPKHGKPSDSGASKAPPRLNRGMPEWKGPGYIPKKKPRQPAANPATAKPVELEHAIPVKSEQTMLEIFRSTFPKSNEFEALKPTLQEIKDALVLRDFDTAFGPEDHKEAYAIRWSPSHALCYAQLLAWMCAERPDDACIKQLLGGTGDGSVARVVCFGGGAAEIMAFSSLLRYLKPLKAAGRPVEASTEVPHDSDATSASTPLIYLNLVDMADWSSVLTKLNQGLNTPPTLSKYASATARAANASFLSPGSVEHAFARVDVLSYSPEDLRATIGKDTALITFMFTLNELYATSIPRTNALLAKITEATPKGSLLLVVDSPGACSEIRVGNSEEGEETRKYPMNWMMDHALIPKPKDDEEMPEPAWKKMVEEVNMLYKLDESLRHPVSLENMRFQVHLFRRI